MPSLRHILGRHVTRGREQDNSSLQGRPRHCLAKVSQTLGKGGSVQCVSRIPSISQPRLILKRGVDKSSVIKSPRRRNFSTHPGAQSIIQPLPNINGDTNVVIIVYRSSRCKRDGTSADFPDRALASVLSRRNSNNVGIGLLRVARYRGCLSSVQQGVM